MKPKNIWSVILSMISMTPMVSTVFASETSIRVPVISEKGEFIHDSIHSIPEYLSFTSTNSTELCAKAWKMNEKASDMLFAVGHPKDYASSGVGVCYTGDAEAALEIALGLGDCAFTDQFSVGRRYVKDGVIHIENASNDDGDDLKWSSIAECE